MVVVADTSPITALLHLQQIHLLKRLYGQVRIPLSVAAELRTLVQFGYDVSFLEYLKPLLDDLIQNLKFRLSDKIYKLALQKAGEE